MKKRKVKPIRLIKLLLTILAIVLLVVMNYQFFSTNFLGTFNINRYVLIISILIGILLVLLMFRKGKIASILLSLLMIFVSFAGISYVTNFTKTFETLNVNVKKSTETYQVYVLKSSGIEKMREMKDLYYAKQENVKDIAALQSDIKTKEKVDVTLSKENSTSELVRKLRDKSIDAIVMSNKYFSLIDLEDQNFGSEIKSIYKFEVEKTSDVATKAQSVNKKQFHIYISGIDAYGDVNEVSRSDVNIIMSVDLEKGKVLLTSTPRDAYVRIPGGGMNEYDKLTHAGIYGVESSKGALEKVYGIEIPYYVKLNFTSFIDMIDLVGGVEVYNDQDFVSRHGNYTFKKGNVKLFSEEALGFVRERYGLKDGDEDRARNQEKVLTALIKKLTQPQTLLNIGPILDQVSKSMQTNIAFSTIMSWVNYQVNEGKELAIQSLQLKAVGQGGLSSFAIPNQPLYMSVIDEDHLEFVKEEMHKIVR